MRLLFVRTRVRGTPPVPLGRGENRPLNRRDARGENRHGRGENRGKRAARGEHDTAALACARRPAQRRLHRVHIVEHFWRRLVLFFEPCRRAGAPSQLGNVKARGSHRNVSMRFR